MDLLKQIFNYNLISGCSLVSNCDDKQPVYMIKTKVAFLEDRLLSSQS